MRFVALMLAVAMLGAGVGLVSVGTVQAHGGDGGGQVEITSGYPACAVVPTVQASALPYTTSCQDVLDGGGGRS